MAVTVVAAVVVVTDTVVVDCQCVVVGHAHNEYFGKCKNTMCWSQGRRAVEYGLSTFLFSSPK